MLLPDWYTTVAMSISYTTTTVCFSVFLVVASISAVMIVIRRNRQPLRTRTPGLLLLQLGFSFILVTQISVDAWLGRHTPCILLLSYSTFGPALVFTPYLLRCWKIFFMFKLQRASQFQAVPHKPSNEKTDPAVAAEPPQELPNVQPEGPLTDTADTESLTDFALPLLGRFHGWYRNLVSRGAIIVICLVFVLLHVLLFIGICVLVSFVPSYDLFGDCDIDLTIVLIVALVEAAIYVVLVAVAAFSLRKVRDEFNISKELYLSLGVMILMLLTLGIGVISQFWVEDEMQYIVATPSITIGLTIDAVIYGLIPVINTFVWARRIRIKRQLQDQVETEKKQQRQPLFSQEGLSEFILDPDNFACLEAYCKAELSVENLYAFRFIQQYRRLAHEPARAKVKAQLIYNTFVSENSPLMLNIRRSQRTAILSALNPANARTSTQSLEIPNPSTMEAAIAQLEDPSTPEPTTELQLSKIPSTHSIETGTTDWPHLFDDIEREILTTMTDTLIRFQGSRGFEKLIASRRTSRRFAMSTKDHAPTLPPIHVQS